VSTLDLTGLKGHHPLGFLAACGLLRCVTESKDSGLSKLGWMSSERESMFAVIESRRPLDIDFVTRMLMARSEGQRRAPALTWSTKVDDRGKYHEAAKRSLQQLLEGASRDAVDMFAALASDLVVYGDSIQSTSFDLTSGNQRLLQSFIEVADWPEVRNAKDKLDAVQAKTHDEDVELKKAKAKLEMALAKAKADFEEALIGPWMYQDNHHSLGWDPQVQRLHALRGKEPEIDKENLSVRAAVFLASQALPLFPCFAIGGRLHTTGFHRHDEDDWFAWPIWREPISLDTLRSLLAHSFSSDLRARGVEVVYRCRRSHTGGSQGNYRIFSHPEERPWPGRHRRRPTQRVAR
jgi:hypothetical protein